MPENKLRKVETVDATPTWIGLLPVYLQTVHTESSRIELARMARFADEYNSFIRSLDKLDSELLTIVSNIDQNEKEKLLKFARTLKQLPSAPETGK